MVQYWLRILGALALIKVASTLVRDAEKLITANVKARNPEIADDVPRSGLFTSTATPEPDTVVEATVADEEVSADV